MEAAQVRSTLRNTNTLCLTEAESVSRDSPWQES